MTRAAATILPVLLLFTFAACAPKRLALPAGDGEPFADFASVFARAAATCASVRTLTAELAVSGRATGARLRLHVLAGFERPASVRLEGVAPFGAPFFIFVARPGEATLLLVRDNRVLSDAPSKVLAALTGLALTPADLGSVLAGCVAADTTPRSGVTLGGWLKVDLTGGESVYLKSQAAGWRIEAGTVGDLVVEYRNFASGMPQTVRLWTRGDPARDAAPTDLFVRLSQVEVNAPLDPAAFRVVVPDDAAPITVDELKQSGPLGSPGAARR